MAILDKSDLVADDALSCIAIGVLIPAVIHFSAVLALLVAIDKSTLINNNKFYAISSQTYLWVTP